MKHKTVPAQIQCRSASKLLLAVLAAGVVLPRATAQPTARPGGTIRFGPADAPLAGVCEADPFDVVPPPPTSCSSNAGAAASAWLQSATSGIVPVRKFRGTVLRYNDFQVADSPFKTVLPADITAVVGVRGFLAAVGPGQAEVAVELKLLDITHGAANPTLVMAKTIYENKVTGEIDPEVSFDLGTVLPFPPNGQLGISVGLGLKSAAELVIEGAEDGFHVLLKRGNRYRLQVELVTAARASLPGAVMISRFGGVDALPDLTSLPNWLNQLAQLFKVRPLGSAFFGQGFTIPGFTLLDIPTGIGDITFPSLSVSLPLPGGISSIASMLQTANLPALVNGRLDLSAFANWLEKQDLGIVEPLRPNLGVTVNDLAVTIATDVVSELAHHPHIHSRSRASSLSDDEAAAAARLGGATSQPEAGAPADPEVTSGGALQAVTPGQLLGTLFLETQLLESRLIPTLYLPRQRGGLIEQIQRLVWSTIESQTALSIGRLETEQARALATQADHLLEGQKEYAAAYLEYCRAYQKLLPAPAKTIRAGERQE